MDMIDRDIKLRRHGVTGASGSGSGGLGTLAVSAAADYDIEANSSASLSLSQSLSPTGQQQQQIQQQQQALSMARSGISAFGNETFASLSNASNSISSFFDTNSQDSSTSKQNSYSNDHYYDGDKQASQKVSANTMSTFGILPLVLVWYGAAVVSISSSKAVLLMEQLPFTLCACQFVAATLGTRFFASRSNSSTTHTSRGIQAMQPPLIPLVRKIAAAYTLGFILTNMSFSLVHASFAETIKASEPLSTVALGMLLLKEQYSQLTFLSLVPICGGVALACIRFSSSNSELTGSDEGVSLTGAASNLAAIGGFALAASSNICFSLRAVLAKQLCARQFAGLLDETSLFHHISSIGLIALIPCALLFEGRKLLFNMLLLGNVRRLLTFSLLLTVNGAAYTVYNLASFYVLSRSSVVVHAVLNVFRRVAIILVTAALFGVSLQSTNLAGIVVAVAGVCVFSIARAREVMGSPRLAGPGTRDSRDTGLHIGSSRDPIALQGNHPP